MHARGYMGSTQTLASSHLFTGFHEYNPGKGYPYRLVVGSLVTQRMWVVSILVSQYENWGHPGKLIGRGLRMDKRWFFFTQCIMSL